MATVGEAKLRMWVQTSDLKKGLTTADSAVSSFASRVKNSGASIISAFGSIGLAINGVALISKGLIAGISGPLKLAADAEQTAVSFKVMLGSAEAAKGMMAELTDFAASTPFEMTEITDSAKKLLAFGVASGDVRGTLEKLGSVSAGLNIPMNELSDIFGKIKTSGRVMGEDINQLAGRGIPIQALLAKQFGVTGEAIKKMVSEGKVNFSHIDQAFTDMTSSGGQFEGLMEAQSHTLGGVFSTMKDGITLALTEIGAAVADTFDLKGAALGVSSMIETVMPMIRTFLANFKAVFQSVKPVIIEVANTLMAWWKLLGSTALSIFTSIGGYVLSWLPSLSTMKEMAIEGLIVLQFAFNNMGQALQMVLLKNVLNIVSFANSVAHFFTSTIPAYLGWFSDNWMKIFYNIGHYPVKIFENTVKNIVKVMANLPGLIAGTTSLSELWTPLTEGAGVALSKLPEIPPRVASELEKSLGKEVDAMAADLGNSYAEFRSQKLAAMVPPETVAALEEVKTKAEEVKTAVAEIIPEELSNRAKELTESAMTDLDKYKTSLTELKDLLAKGLITQEVFDKSKMDALPSKVKDIIEQSKSPMEKFQEQLKELQSFKLEGLINDQQFQSAALKLQEELFKEDEKEVGSKSSKVELASTAEFGSKEARDAILKNRFGGPDNKSLEKTSKQQLIVQQQQAGYLKTIAGKNQETFVF